MICEVVYAELTCQFSVPRELDAFLEATGIRLIPSGRESLQAASVARKAYLSRRDRRLQCSSCGCLTRDFIIGAHALAYADRLLTRDTGFYHRYFPGLRLND